MTYLFKMKGCYFCTNNIRRVDYKETDSLRRFLDPFSRLLAHKQTGVCSKHQRQLKVAVKRARYLALLPFAAP
jgi:small subunit ribosomal protein S18